jgi:hypothetical protein
MTTYPSKSSFNPSAEASEYEMQAPDYRPMLSSRNPFATFACRVIFKVFGMQVSLNTTTSFEFNIY